MPLPEAFEYFDVEGEIEQLYNNLKRKNPKISREWVAKSFRSALTFTGNYNAAPLERLPGLSFFFAYFCSSIFFFVFF